MNKIMTLIAAALLSTAGAVQAEQSAPAYAPPAPTQEQIQAMQAQQRQAWEAVAQYHRELAERNARFHRQHMEPIFAVRDRILEEVTLNQSTAEELSAEHEQLRQDIANGERPDVDAYFEQRFQAMDAEIEARLQEMEQARKANDDLFAKAYESAPVELSHPLY